jgi:hypothetical protein
MCMVSFFIWEVLHENGKDLQTMWFIDDPAEVEKWEIRFNISQAEILLDRLLQKISSNKRSPNRQRREKAGTKNTMRPMPEVWGKKGTNAPHGWESSEQLYTKLNSALSKMPCREACSELHMGSTKKIKKEAMPCLWGMVPAEETEGYTLQKEVMSIKMGAQISRIAMETKDRVNRLKAIGNGQVPLVAATAWQVLIDMIELTKKEGQT